MPCIGGVSWVESGGTLKSGSRTRERLVDSAYPAQRFYPEPASGTNSQ